MQLEVIFMTFLHCQRQADFEMYIDTLSKMCLGCFTSTSSIMHVGCPHIYMTYRTSRDYHLTPIQIDEQLNAVVKGDGGIIGISENEDSLKRWITAGPEISDMLIAFKTKFERKKGVSNKHHEQIPSTQHHFALDVKNTISSFERYGNPFADQSCDLFSMDTKVVLLPEIVFRMENSEELGQKEYNKFVARPNTQFYGPIHKNESNIFIKKGYRKSTKNRKVSTLKTDVNLFARLHVSCQNREGD